MDGSLVTVPTPFLLESPASWFKRVCFLHNCSPFSMEKLFALNCLYDFDREASARRLDIMVAGTTVSKHVVWELARPFGYIRSRRSARTFLLYDADRLPFYRFCPECLRSDTVPYWRFTWRMRHVRLCPVHRCLLYSLCPRCRRPLAPWRRDFSGRLVLERADIACRFCTNCGADLAMFPLRVDIRPDDVVWRQVALQRVTVAAIIAGYFRLTGIEQRLPLRLLPRALMIGAVAPRTGVVTQEKVPDFVWTFITAGLGTPLAGPIEPEYWMDKVLQQRFAA